MPLEEVFAEVKRKLTDNHVLLETTEPRVLIAHAFSTVLAKLFVIHSVRLAYM